MNIPSIVIPDLGLSLNDLLLNLEHQLVDQALERTKGNKSRAAKLLGLKRTTLVERLRKRGLMPPLKIKRNEEQISL